MPIAATTEPLTQVSADALVIGIHAEAPPTGFAVEFDRASGGLLSRLIEAKEISGKKCEVVTLLAPAGVNAKQVVVVGLGSKDAFDRGTANRAASAAAKSLAAKERGKVAFYLADGWLADVAEAAVCGSLVGCVGQDLYRSKKSRFPLADMAWAGVDAAVVKRGEILADAVNLTRRLVNEPPSEMYPESFAAEAARVAEESGIKIEVWDQARLEAERCGSLLAVARGSDREPRLVILRYSGGPSNQAPLALVGKGVTFDSGGLSIKPTDGMKTMKCDMAGAATVVGAMQAIAKLKLPVNVIGLCGLVENMLSGKSYKLGDVLRSRSGKTIEVLNTDAEGRLVLADVLDVCLQNKPAKIIDLATLTGACVVALGNDVAGLMTNDQPWADAVKSASDACGEPMWQLPMFPEYGEQIKSEVADIKNVGEGRWGGAITAGKFLEEFVQGKPWVHLDIAGPAFLESSKSWLEAGGSGYGVRTLVEVARKGTA
ncbi:MAG TPA: leucyl aminopeptidase [Pirellulaceae bacterium]|nr:leucyl aminopeptidase [Pirellulaceae bacterium]